MTAAPADGRVYELATALRLWLLQLPESLISEDAAGIPSAEGTPSRAVGDILAELPAAHKHVLVALLAFIRELCGGSTGLYSRNFAEILAPSMIHLSAVRAQAAGQAGHDHEASRTEVLIQLIDGADEVTQLYVEKYEPVAATREADEVVQLHPEQAEMLVASSASADAAGSPAPQDAVSPSLPPPGVDASANAKPAAAAAAPMEEVAATPAVEVGAAGAAELGELAASSTARKAAATKTRLDLQRAAAAKLLEEAGSARASERGSVERDGAEEEQAQEEQAQDEAEEEQDEQQQELNDPGSQAETSESPDAAPEFELTFEEPVYTKHGCVCRPETKSRGGIVFRCDPTLAVGTHQLLSLLANRLISQICNLDHAVAVDGRITGTAT